MPDILHRVGVASTPEPVFAALTTIDGLAGWWTDSVEGEADAGGALVLRFGADELDILVVEHDAATRVAWEVTGGPREWIGTRILWDLRGEDDQTTIVFAHQLWREQVEFMHQCSTKWATFLFSLKSLVESGAGAPYPRDVRVSNWG